MESGSLSRGSQSLSLTCSLFRSICQNLLFKKIRSSSDNSLEYPEWKERIKQCVLRMEGLSHNPVHRYSVTTMNLEGTQEYWINNFQQAFPQERVSEIYQTLVSSFLLALETFTNLRHVHLGPYITITDEFVHALSRLPNLDELVIHGPFLTSIASPMIAVKALRLYDGEDGVSGLGLFSAQRITSLNIRNITFPDSLLRHELARQEVNFLTRLSLQVEISQVPAIFSFLPSCRNLERLVLSPFARPFADKHLYRIPSLPKNSLPRLSSFIGPVKLAQSILLGRPVIDIEITGLYEYEHLTLTKYYEWDVEALEDTFLRPLRQTSVPLRRIRAPLIPLSGKMLEVICRYFPQLQSLALGLNYRTIRRSKITKEDKRLMAFLQENDTSTDFNSYLAQNETLIPDPLEEYDPDSEGFYDNEEERPHLLRVAVKDICEGRAPLPKGLASLKISVVCIAMPKGYHVWPTAEECATVLTLSRLYPALDILAFGYVDFDELPVRHWARNKNTGGRWELSAPPPPEEDTEFL